MKFDFIPRSIQEDIEGINDINTLEKLFRKSIMVASVEEFEKLLDKAEKVM